MVNRGLLEVASGKALSMSSQQPNISWDQTLGIKNVPSHKEEQIQEFISSKTSLVLTNTKHWSISFTADKYATTRMCYANYKTSSDCTAALQLVKAKLLVKTWA